MLRTQMMLEERKQFIINAAIGAKQGKALQVNFKALAAMAMLCEYEKMETPKAARETFIRVLTEALAKNEIQELLPACFTLHYNISVSVPCGWRSARAHSECITIGGKGYIYKCRVADAPDSKRQYYDPEWWADLEIGKGKLIPC